MKPQTVIYTLLLGIKIYQANSTGSLKKRSLQPSHEMSQNEKWKKFFIDKKFDDVTTSTSLVHLVVNLSSRYLDRCTPIITYDSASENRENQIINGLLQKFIIPQIHGDIHVQFSKNSELLGYNETCKVHILLVKDVMDTNTILGSQNRDKVIVITKSSQWRVHEYLADRSSQKILNLLVISESEMVVKAGEQIPFVLYTHELYIDAIASSKHIVLTSWRNGNFTRPNLNLFPKKLSNGFAGHRFLISLAHFPPFVIKRGFDSNDNIKWDGLEVRLVRLLARTFNFTIDFKEASNADALGSTDAVVKTITEGEANLGISGIFVSSEIIQAVDISNMYYRDCAAFMTLTSTALPRYRAIMGPFHWTVWLSLTFIYLFAIFPLTFSYKHTLRPLLESPEEMENMFWYVFGTFTNAFTFSQGDSWTNSDKMATKVFIGFYWLFTIIISSCYTGSIIAFVTLPVYPDTIDYVSQLLEGRYQVGTLDKGGWVDRFSNSSDLVVEKLLNKVDLVPTVEEGVKNTTKAFFWPYAFLGSSANLDYIIRTQFVSTKKRAALHVSDECLVSYGIAITFPKNSEYVPVLKAGLDRIVQGGFMSKIKNDVEWLMVRSASGKLLAASKGRKNILVVEDRALTTDDTQGMFLLLGIGFTLGGICLFFEIFGGCFNLCKKKDRFRKTSSISSNPRSHNGTSFEQRGYGARMVSTIDFSAPHISTIVDERILSNGVSGVDLEVLKDASSSNDLDGSNESGEIDNEIDALFDFEDCFGEKTTGYSNQEDNYSEYR